MQSTNIHQLNQNVTRKGSSPEWIETPIRRLGERQRVEPGPAFTPDAPLVNLGSFYPIEKTYPRDHHAEIRPLFLRNDAEKIWTDAEITGYNLRKMCG